MSNLFFPLALLDDIKITQVDSTLIDTFESGTTNARGQWPARFFKRQFELTTTSLTLNEFRWLRSFIKERGTLDSFWLRDNVGRDGNACVRFTELPQFDRNAVMYKFTLKCAEIAPAYALPEWDQIIVAAGTAPALWYDANREQYILDQGNVITEEAAYDAFSETYPAPWAGSGLNLGNLTGQYQYYQFAGGNRAATVANIAGFAAGKPACTIFAIAKQSTCAGNFVLFSLGGTGSNQSMGLMLNSSNKYIPFIGSAGTWTGFDQTSVSGHFRSIAVVFPSGADGNSFYIDSFLEANSDSNARSFVPGPAFLGSDPSAGRILNADSSLASAFLAQVLVFPAALTAGQIKAVHNLFGAGAMYGLSKF